MCNWLSWACWQQWFPTEWRGHRWHLLILHTWPGNLLHRIIPRYWEQLCCYRQESYYSDFCHSSKYPDEFNCKIYSHWILLGTKNINGIRYSSPWIANEPNGLNTAFGCTDSWKEWVLEEYNWRRYTLSQASDASCWWDRMLGLMDHWSVCSCDLDNARFVVIDVDSNLQNNGYWVR